jgi:hypothetical protein
MRDWLARVGDGPQARPPESLASLLATSIAMGRSTKEAAVMLRPYFEGSAVRARRAARTYGAFVASERNLATSEALGDLVIGYRVFDPGGPTARKDHLRRSGQTYWREPKPGQIGFQKMPVPPLDKGGPNEDDPPGIKWGCRCWLEPILRPL